VTAFGILALIAATSLNWRGTAPPPAVCAAFFPRAIGDFGVFRPAHSPGG